MSVHLAYDVVIPSVGRPSLPTLLESLDRTAGPGPGRIVVVDDRAAGRGPAAARNAGWRDTTAEWVVFLDDDVVVTPSWGSALAADLRAAGPEVAAVQGRIEVPLPAGRRPTDWERNVAGLQRARWASADIAYRRSALAAVDGFDERFTRAYREDSDIAVRLRRAGWRLVRGQRTIVHPVRPASRWVSLAKQAGNIDDARMDRLHRRGWRAVATAPRGRRRAHVAVTLAAATALGAGIARRRRAALAAGSAWLVGTAELAWRRIAPGPRTSHEVGTMLATSAALPFAATGAWLAGVVASRGAQPKTARRPRPDAVLLDRDGTLVANVPYNGDPGRVSLMPGARAAVERLRAAGVPLAVISNQSGIGRGVLTAEQVETVNRRIEELLGPLGPWLVCPHHPDAGCSCRKPQPGLLRSAAAALGVDPARCAVVGDIGADVQAAHAVGARGVLVPTTETLAEEVAAAPEVAGDLEEAVEMLLGDAR